MISWHRHPSRVTEYGISLSRLPATLSHVMWLHGNGTGTVEGDPTSMATRQCFRPGNFEQILGDLSRSDQLFMSRK